MTEKENKLEEILNWITYNKIAVLSTSSVLIVLFGFLICIARRVKLHKISTIALIFLLANLFAIGEWISFSHWQNHDNLKLLMGIKTDPVGSHLVNKNYVTAWAAFHFISWTLSGIAFWYLTSIYFAFTSSLQYVMTLDDT
jgi:hypothetical protein